MSHKTDEQLAAYDDLLVFVIDVGVGSCPLTNDELRQLGTLLDAAGLSLSELLSHVDDVENEDVNASIARADEIGRYTIDVPAGYVVCHNTITLDEAQSMTLDEIEQLDDDVEIIAGSVK